jgi:hypothetical protein
MAEDKEFENKIPSIHTLESDLASAVRNEDYGKNIIKIVTDPSKNSLLQSTPEEQGSVGGVKKINMSSVLTKKNILVSVIAIFILASAGVIFYILYKAKNVEEDKAKAEARMQQQAIATTTEGNSPVVKNSNVLNPEILQAADFSKLSKGEIIAEISKIKQTLADKKIQPNNNIGINTNLTVGELFQKLRYSGDNSLIRSFDDIYAFGLYSTKEGVFENYLLVKVNNFDLAFKSILDWEKYMPVDLKDVFIGNNEVKNINTSETSTTTPEKIYAKKDTGVFVDRVLKNYDIREYIKNSDNSHIIYGFINSKYLLITSGESSFIDIKDRLLKDNILR